MTRKNIRTAAAGAVLISALAAVACGSSFSAVDGDDAGLPDAPMGGTGGLDSEPEAAGGSGGVAGSGGIGGSSGVGGSLEAGSDGDAPYEDASPDVIVFDGIGDADVEDAPMDADAAVDADVEDAPTDADATTADADAGPLGGCADGTVEQDYGPTMVGCDGQSNQCGAGALCAPGWHLCTVAKYVARGGDVAKATAVRWLAGCIREDCGTVHAPTADVCATCDLEESAPVAASWTCQGVDAYSVRACWAGVAAGNLILTVGSPSAQCGYAAQSAASAQGGATCCR